MRYRFGKAEKLKSRKLIAKLFEEGKSHKKFPVRMIYLPTSHTSKSPIQAGFSVPKRNFKRAVDRNRIKRLLREAYRLQKPDLYPQLKQPYIIMFTFIGREMPSFNEVEQKIQQVLALFIQEEKNHDHEANED